MSFETLGLPVLALNGYLWDTMKRVDKSLPTKYGSKVPFFPIGDSVSGQKQWENKPYFIYDRVFRYRNSPFYPSKVETVLYHLKAKEVDSLLWSSAVQLILDRQDDAAKDINDWIRNSDSPEDYPVFFHNVKIYQARASASSSESRLREDTSKPYYITEFMIDICYHITKSLEDFIVP